MKDPLNAQNHRSARKLLRIAGPICLALGVVCLLVGTIEFFVSTSSFGGGPKLFWLNFIGLPLVAFGIMMTLFGYMGAITRYQGREIAPAVSHTFNEIAKGTKPGVRDTFSAIREGLTGDTPSERICPACSESNDPDAKFCDACGEALPISAACASCGAVNDPDARFCDACGQSLSRA